MANKGWGNGVDPTAGVVIKIVRKCPRCGFIKGGSEARPGLCESCAVGMTDSERKIWNGP